MILPENPYLAMAENNAWANATLYGAMSTLSNSSFAAPRPGFFGSLKRTMNHIYEVDLYYLDALRSGGLGRSLYQREDIGNVSELATAQARTDADFVDFCRKLTPDILNETRQTERKDKIATENVCALVLHLVQHQIHHRGQAHVMLGEAGVEPPQLDDFYLEFGRVPSANPFWRRS